jgi:ectoine hydroxylase-related dioxygenase (phytanoyl-CoA dioxygenase family)
VPHVQPPVELLGKMLAVRLHLDDCDETNGALRVLPGTHWHGRLTANRVTSLRQETPEIVCRAQVGDALLMRPLLLHASGRSQGEGHRRVLHIEFAGFELPEGLRFHEAA